MMNALTIFFSDKMNDQTERLKNLVFMKENIRLHQENSNLKHLNSNLSFKLKQIRCKVENILMEISDIPQGLGLRDRLEIKGSSL